MEGVGSVKEKGVFNTLPESGSVALTVTTLAAASFSATVAEYGAPTKDGFSFTSLTEITTTAVSVREPASVTVSVKE